VRLGFVPIQRHLDRAVQLLRFDRLHEIAEWLHLLCAVEGAIVGVSRQKHDRSQEFLAEHVSRFDPVALTLEPDVHENEVRASRAGASKGVIRRGRDRERIVAKSLKHLLNVHGDDLLVLDDQDGWGLTWRHQDQDIGEHAVLPAPCSGVKISTDLAALRERLPFSPTGVT